MQQQPISPVIEQVAKVAKKATDSPAEQDRILSRPVDIVCFGRAGVGKTALLEALTGRYLGSTPRLGHGTQALTAIELSQSVPVGDATKDVVIRFWDTKGIDEWNGETLQRMFDDLRAKNVNPLCVLYCAAPLGRVEPDVVQSILDYFHTNDVLVFYVVTNMYAGSDEQIDDQIKQGGELLRRITKLERVPRTKSGLFGQKEVSDVFSFGSRVHLLAVNSKQYISKRAGATKPAKNVDELMTLCVENLDEEKLVEYFLATLNNRDFWAQAADKLKDVFYYLSKTCNTSLETVMGWAEKCCTWLGDQIEGVWDSIFG